MSDCLAQVVALHPPPKKKHKLDINFGFSLFGHGCVAGQIENCAAGLILHIDVLCNACIPDTVTNLSLNECLNTIQQISGIESRG